MIFKAENDNFTLAVKEMGAELTSLKSKKTGFEFIWLKEFDDCTNNSSFLIPLKAMTVKMNAITGNTAEIECLTPSTAVKNM